MAIKTSSAKAKGRRLQKWMAEHISDLLDIPWGKDELIASREMGQSGVDVRLIGKAKELFPFAVECKNQETWSIPKWIKQAQSNEDDDTCWLVVCARNRAKPIVIMDAEEFFELYKKILKRGKDA